MRALASQTPSHSALSLSKLAISASYSAPLGLTEKMKPVRLSAIGESMSEKLSSVSKFASRRSWAWRIAFGVRS